MGADEKAEPGARGRSGRSRSHVRFAGFQPQQVRITFDPYVSVLALACEAVRDGHPRSVGLLSEQVRNALAPMVAPGRSLSPDCVTPTDPARDTRVAAEIDRLRSLSSAELLRDFEATFDEGQLPAHWAGAVEQPRRWAWHFAAAIEQVWSVLEPHWRRSADRRHQEAERIAAAAARGALDVALAEAHPRGNVEDATLTFPDPEAVDVDAVGRAPVLAPMVGPASMGICNLDLPDVVWFAYPLLSAAPAHGQHPTDQLDALLTPIRAHALRLLDRERPMHEVAGLLYCSPAAATHHCNRLAAAGLLHRQRDGRTVLVTRTRRAERLLQLYTD